MRKNRRPVASSGRVGLMVAAAAVAGGGVVARGQTVVTWVGTTGNYVDGANWSSGATPANANNEYLQINNGGTAQVSSEAQGAFLHLGYQPGDIGNLQLTGGTLTLGELRVGGRETIPDPANAGQFIGNGGGTGTVVQSGTSTLSVTYSTGTEPPVQSLYVGDSGLASGNTANGSYTIRDSAVLNNGITSSDEIVVGTGPGARGTFTQEGNSTVNSAGRVTVGRRGATASYSLSGTGTLAPLSNLYVGDADTVDGATAGTVGVFNQSGGTVSTKATMEIGRKGGTGTYTISGGTLALGAQLNIGSAGTSGSPAAPLPGQQNSVGSLNISGSANVTTTNGFNVFVGFNNGQTTYQPTLTSSAYFNMTGGTMTLSNTLFMIGSGSGTSGVATITGGILQNATGTTVEYDVGRSAGNGTLNVSGTGTIKGGSLLVGGNTNPIGGSGTLNVSENANISLSGNLTLSASLVSGDSPVRTININGGTLTVGAVGGTTTVVGLVNGQPAISRSFNMTAGSLSASGNLTGGSLVNWNFSGGSATFGGSGSTLTSSTLNVSNTANLTFATLAGGTGTLNQTGGTLSITTYQSNTATTTISGGTTTIGNVNTSGTQGGSITISGGTVNVPGAMRIAFNSPATPASLTITGGNVTFGSLFSGGSVTSPSTLNLSGGNLSIGPVTLNGGAVVNTDNAISLSSTISLGGGIAVNNNTGSLSLAGAVTFPANGATITKSGSGTLNLSGAWNYNATPGTPTLAATAGTTNVNVNLNGPANISVAAGATVKFGANQNINAISITGGLVDLDTRSATLASPAPGLVSYLNSAHNGGTWTGTSGLTSTAAKNRGDHATGIGYYDNGAQVQIKYTWMGDLNLDGKINGDDYTLIDRGFALHLSSWVNGDVNYDGSVTVADYAVIDAAFGHQNGGLSPAFLAAREAQFGSEYVANLIAAVPEPGTAALLALIALPGISRRHRRR